MAKISPYAFFQEFDNNGNPLSNGKLYTYESGTSTPKATYTDAGESTQNPNPVILDAYGRADVWLDSGAYKFVLKTSEDVLVKEKNDIVGEASNVFGGSVVEISTNTTITESYENNILDCTGTITLSLLDAVTAEEGFIFTVKNSGAGIVTIDPDSAELIDGVSNVDIYSKQSALVVCTGSAWKTVFLGQYRRNNYTATVAPTVSNDTTEGYAPGSYWYDVTGDDAYVCLDSTTGAAVWLLITFTKEAADLLYSPISLMEGIKGKILSGLTLSNNSTDATNDIDIASGAAVAGAGTAVMSLSSTLTKRLDAAWSVGTGNGGLDTGSIADTTYFVWLIQRSDTGVVDALFSTSPTSPTMPTNYDRKVRIGIILRESGSIVGFKQYGKKFMRNTPVQCINTITSTTAALLTLTGIPVGLKVLAVFSSITDTSSNAFALLYSDPDMPDVAPSFATGIGNVMDQGGDASDRAFGMVEVATNTSAQVRWRSSLASRDTDGAAFGWVDYQL